MSNTRIIAGLALIVTGVGLAIALAGCSSEGSTTQPAVASARPAVSGAQLWSETCGQCHNLRSPSEFGSAEWQVIVHHMRLRAGLTGEQQKTITEFLQSASK